MIYSRPCLPGMQIIDLRSRRPRPFVAEELPHMLHGDAERFRDNCAFTDPFREFITERRGGISAVDEYE